MRPLIITNLQAQLSSGRNQVRPSAQRTTGISTPRPSSVFTFALASLTSTLHLLLFSILGLAGVSTHPHSLSSVSNTRASHTTVSAWSYLSRRSLSQYHHQETLSTSLIWVILQSSHCLPPASNDPVVLLNR